MSEIDAAIKAGEVLRKLINENYNTQEDFAFEFGCDIRTVNRYVNNGINKLDLLQELAKFFDIDIIDFFK